MLYQIPALLSGLVIDWLYSAAYAWIVLYGAFHLLAICNRLLRPERARAFSGKWFLPVACSGVIATGISLYYAFAGTHIQYGVRALIVLLIAFVVAGVSFSIECRHRLPGQFQGRTCRTWLPATNSNL